MGWDEPTLSTIKAKCDKCGATESIEPVNTVSGHWVYPQPGERGSMGWDYDENGDLLCPDCHETSTGL